MHRVVAVVGCGPGGELLQAVFAAVNQHHLNARCHARRKRLVIF